MALHDSERLPSRCPAAISTAVRGHPGWTECSAERNWRGNWKLSEARLCSAVDMVANEFGADVALAQIPHDLTRIELLPPRRDIAE
jgi:flagellar motor protein MotB